MGRTPLEVTRPQLLDFRRRVAALDRRLPPSRRPLRAAAWATRELARRFLHVFGPSDAGAFARWAGIPARKARPRSASSEAS